MVRMASSIWLCPPVSQNDIGVVPFLLIGKQDGFAEHVTLQAVQSGVIEAVGERGMSVILSHPRADQFFHVQPAEDLPHLPGDVTGSYPLGTGKAKALVATTACLALVDVISMLYFIRCGTNLVKL